MVSTRFSFGLRCAFIVPIGSLSGAVGGHPHACLGLPEKFTRPVHVLADGFVEGVHFAKDFFAP